ncbi:hypothetical protein AVL60_07380 [Kocuria palustris]|nr:hypothetical protein AVL60_07380 [Kocuria palustris]
MRAWRRASASGDLPAALGKVVTAVVDAVRAEVAELPAPDLRSLRMVRRCWASWRRRSARI